MIKDAGQVQLIKTVRWLREGLDVSFKFRFLEFCEIFVEGM